MDDIRDGIDDAFRRAFLQRRGPMPGFGRSAGRPWRGIVEKTPALWVTWITGACKRAGVDPLSVRLTFSGQPLEMATVELTFGTRYYWLCPRCGNRCEAVYATRACVACRECSHLGYESQATRPSSPFRTLNLIFSRRAHGLPRRYDPSEESERMLVAGLRGLLMERITHVVAQVEAAPAP